MDLKLSVLIAAVDQASGPLGNINKAVASVAATGGRLKSWGQEWQQTGQQISAFAAQGRAVLESMLAPAQAVEESLAELSQVAKSNLGGDVAGTLQNTRDAAVAWSQSHVGSAQEYIAATQKMIAAGAGEAQAIQGAAAALSFATANKIGAAAATKGLIFAYESMGDTSADAGAEMKRLGDVLTKVQQQYQLDNIAALPEAMSKAIPAAKQTGVSFEELAVTMAALEKAGLKGEGAGEKLGQALSGMSGASKKLGFDLVKTSDGGLDFAATLKNLEGKVGDLKNMSPDMAAKLRDAFGPGSEAIMKLIGQSGSLQGQLEGVKQSAGATAEAAAAMDRAASAKIFQQNIDALKIELAAGLLPALQTLMPVVTSVIQSFAGFAKENPTLTKIAGTLAVVAVAAASVVGPVTTGIGAFMSIGGAILSAVPAIVAFGGALFSAVVPALVGAATSAWAFAAALLANPITWIVLAIVGAALLIYTYWDEIVGYFTGIWDGISAAFDEGFVQGVVAVLMALDPFAHLIAAFDFLLEEVTGFSLADIGQIIVDEVAGWLDAIAGFFGGFSLDAAVQGIVDGAIAVFLFFVPVDLWIAAFDAIVGWLSGFSLDGAVQAIVDGAMAVLGFFVPIDLFMAGLDVVMSWLSGFSLSGAASSIVSSALAPFTGFDPMASVMAPLNAVQGFFAGFSLADAGSNIINTLVQGILSMANAPAEAMSGIVANLRAYLPFSPAKVGPLRDLNKIRLVETVAENIKPGPLEAAMSTAVDGAMGPLSNVPVTASFAAAAADGMPRAAAAPPMSPAATAAAATSGAAGTAGGSVTFQINLSGNGTPVEQLEEWLRDPVNAGRMVDAGERYKQARARTAYG